MNFMKGRSRNAFYWLALTASFFISGALTYDAWISPTLFNLGYFCCGISVASSHYWLYPMKDD